MPKIFISYRRDDSGHAADRIYEKLAQRFDLFFDVNGIPLGVDWKDYLTTNVQECALMVVIIGRDWLNIIEQRASRQDDFVRFEIENALNRGIPIIPLFLDGLTGIPEDRLPRSIVRLAARQGMQIRRASDFDHDIGRLIEGIERLLAAKPASPTSVGTGRAPSAASARDLLLKLLPKPFDILPIPAGSVTLGKGEGATGGYIKSATTVEVAAFMIAKYPMTNAQFQVFVDVDEGYLNAAWWDYSANAKAWRTENIRPQDPAFGGVSDHPRANVCWYEAVAFCRWLSSKIDGEVRLPTDAEWQRAAQGIDGREYPWGNQALDKTRLNYAVNIGETTSVTAYEGKGDSPYGVVDMAGNVWEWCQTAYESGSNSVNGTDVRLLRGGSWRSFPLPQDFRTAYGGRRNPHGGGNFIGFRFVLASLSLLSRFA